MLASILLSLFKLTCCCRFLWTSFTNGEHSLAQLDLLGTHVESRTSVDISCSLFLPAVPPSKPRTSLSMIFVVIVLAPRFSLCLHLTSLVPASDPLLVINSHLLCCSTLLLVSSHSSPRLLYLPPRLVSFPLLPLRITSKSFSTSRMVLGWGDQSEFEGWGGRPLVGTCSWLLYGSQVGRNEEELKDEKQKEEEQEGGTGGGAGAAAGAGRDTVLRQPAIRQDGMSGSPGAHVD